MRLAVLSDVHGNLPALEACLARLDRMVVDERVFLGDAVGYLPQEVECIELLISSGFLCQRGNHEAMLLHPDERARKHESVYRLDEARARLDSRMLKTLESWPASRLLEADGRKLLFIHGTPDEPLDGYAYPDTDLSTWTDLPYGAVFMGNTHRPFETRRGSCLIANVGSVGLPRDVGRLACFAVHDTVDDTCTHYRVPFNVDRLLQQVGDIIHPSTRECLHRDATQFVGQVVP